MGLTMNKLYNELTKQKTMNSLWNKQIKQLTNCTLNGLNNEQIVQWMK